MRFGLGGGTCSPVPSFCTFRKYFWAWLRICKSQGGAWSGWRCTQGNILPVAACGKRSRGGQPTCTTVFVPTYASIFFQSLSNLRCAGKVGDLVMPPSPAPAARGFKQKRRRISRTLREPRETGRAPRPSTTRETSWSCTAFCFSPQPLRAPRHVEAPHDRLVPSRINHGPGSERLRL